MGIEAELKTRVHDPNRVRGLLRYRATQQNSVYFDVYFDTPDRTLTRAGRELRVREVHTDDDTSQTLLTYKDAPVHTASESKPETETTVGDAHALRAVLTALGFDVLISFEKHCANYRFTAAGRPLLATLVSVPELEETFLEIETIVDTDTEVDPALETIRQVLATLGIDRNDETIEAYTEAVTARRSKRRNTVPIEQGRIFREAWIAGVKKHHPGDPKAGYIASWEQTPEWERESAAAVYEQVRAFIEITDGRTAKLSRTQKGRFVALCWIGQIFKHFPDPKPSYVADWDEIPQWQQETDADIFERIEHGV